MTWICGHFSATTAHVGPPRIRTVSTEAKRRAMSTHQHSRRRLGKDEKGEKSTSVRQDQTAGGALQHIFFTVTGAMDAARRAEQNPGNGGVQGTIEPEQRRAYGSGPAFCRACNGM